jgi:hypothetical protein
MTNPFYLVEREYVGFDECDSRGNPIGDSRVMEIRSVPGVTNMSRQARIDGWLGTSGDIAKYARGEYATLDEARAEANRRGFTHRLNDEEADRHIAASFVFDPDVIERWVP